MKFAILDQFDLPRKGKNLGDYVQTIAARQFINDEFIYIDEIAKGIETYISLLDEVVRN